MRVRISLAFAVLLLAGCPFGEDEGGLPRLGLMDGGGRLDRDRDDRTAPRDDDLDPTLPPPITPPRDGDAGPDDELVPPEYVDGGAPGADAGDDELVPPDFADGGAPAADAGPGSPPATRCYEEPVFPSADVSDLVSAYGGSDWKDDLISIVARRWPGGERLLEEQRDDSYFDRFSDSSSWSGMMEELATLVHEETHLFNAYHAQREGRSHSLYVRGDLIVYPPAMEGFARSEIHSMVTVRPSSYASLYLTGEQGRRGFVALLDEASCYINEMAALAVLGDQYRGSGFSSRDGAVAFLYYIELYLRRAREAHPEFWEMARADETIREHVLTQWLRVHFFLPHSDRFSSLGIYDGDFRDAMHEPENVAELEMFLGVRLGDSPCVL